MWRNAQSRHLNALRTSNRLSRFAAHFGIIPPIGVIPIFSAIKVLNHAHCRFVLVGSRSMGGWMREPRASTNVDFVVADRDFRKGVRAIATRFPRLQTVEGKTIVRFLDPLSEQIVVQLFTPAGPFRSVFQNSVSLRWRGQDLRIPSLEMAIVMKFVAMTSPKRGMADQHQDAHDFLRLVNANSGMNETAMPCRRQEGKKYYDAGDFVNMIRANADIDFETLAELGDVVFGGGGEDIVEKVRKVRAGEKLIL